MTISISADGAPLVPGRRLLLGHLPSFRRDALGLLQRAADLGPVTRLDMGPRGPGYLVWHPDGVKRVLLDAVDQYSKRTRGFEILRDAMGNGLLTSEGDFWRRQRRIAQPAFHHREIARFAEIIVEAGQALADDWARRPPKEAFDVFEEMMQVTLRAVGECLFSVDPTERANEIGLAITVIVGKFARRAISPLSLPLSWPLPGHAEMRRAIDTLTSVVDEIIAARRKGGARERADLLDLLMVAKDDQTDERMTDRQLRDEVLTLIVAGHETTASTLAWTFFLLSEHPEIDEALGVEIDKLGDKAPTLADLERVPLVGQVVRESLRLFPPAWFIARRAEVDDEICGVRIPARSLVFVSPYATHRRPELFARPNEFNPYRFAPNAGPTGGFSRFAFFPFGGGPRVCIGHGFALMEAQLLLIVLRRRFRLSLVPGARPRPSPQLTLRARHGIWMTADRQS